MEQNKASYEAPPVEQDGYEAPAVEQVNTEDDPAVTCAMLITDTD